MDDVNLPLRHRYATDPGGRHTGIIRGLRHVLQQLFKSPGKVQAGSISGQLGVDPADEFINIPNVKSRG